MTSLHQTVSTVHSSSTTNHDDKLDALLEDLQTSVSRPGSSLAMNGGSPPSSGLSGYREVTRTIRKETNGMPAETSREYHIEYLNPANTTTHIQETSISPKAVDYVISADSPGQRNASTYKTVSYQYNTSGSTKHDSGSGSDLRLRQNITELDSLLDDLHTAQKTGFAADGQTSMSRSTVGIDSGLIEPLESSTPHGHISRSMDKRSYQEQRYGSVGRQASSPAREVKRELVFTGGNNNAREQSPLRQQRKEIYRYETKTTRSSSGGSNARDVSPPPDRRQPSPSPNRSVPSSSPSGRQLLQSRTYNYSATNDEVPRTATFHRSPSPIGKVTSTRTYNYSSNTSNRDFSPEGPRSPTPTREVPITKTTVRAYNYNRDYNSPAEPPPPRGPRSPSPSYHGTNKVTTVHSYNYNTTKETRHPEPPRSPTPHRSPSPVSFPQPPLPNIKSTTTTKTYNFDQSPRPQSPQPPQKFSPSDPSRTLTHHASPQQPPPTVITYKYSSQSTHSTKFPGDDQVPLLPRPFPNPSPSPPPEQQPPKKLDDLMASFSDTENYQRHETEKTTTRYTNGTAHVPPASPAQQREVVLPLTKPAPPTPVPVTPDQPKSKNVAGPPVYYPPGVELFSKKEDAMMQQSSGGGGKMKAKAKYEYEASGKSKSKSSSGKTVVPVCLPVCCAMPCVIM